MTQWLPNSATISGSFGNIHVPPFFHGAHRFEIRNLNGRTEDPFFTVELVEAAPDMGPLAYQAIHVAERVADGEIESDVMSPGDTVATLRMLEAIRESARSRIAAHS
jgi:predicted dehydrogenase